MFEVDIEVDGEVKTYYVWDKGELIEVKFIESDGYISIDESISLDVCIKALDDKVCLIVRHLHAVMISKEDHDTYMKSLDSNELVSDFLPVTEITDFEYDLLYETYTYQDLYQEDIKKVQEIDKALESAKKYVKK